MTDSFLDVFKVNQQSLPSVYREEFNDVHILRIARNHLGDAIRVYISSNHLIPAEAIFRMQDAISEVCFNGQMKVYILPDFSLSKLYTPENLYEAYKDSLVFELQQQDHVMASLLKTAQVAFEDGMTVFTLEQSTLAVMKQEELENFLSEVFNARCHVETRIAVEISHEEKHSRFAEENALKVEQMVEAIRKRNTPEEKDNSQDVIGAVPKEKEKGKPKGDAGKASENKASKPTKEASQKVQKGTESERPRREYSSYSRKKSEDPNTVFGYDIMGESVPISSIKPEDTNVIIRGQIRMVEDRTIKDDRHIYKMEVTDFTDTMTVKLFLHPEQYDELKDVLVEKKFFLFEGMLQYDAYDKDHIIGSVKGIMKIKDFRVMREDTAVRKRVELHCHTKMSDMDGITDVTDLVKRAYSWGHRALAITDHGVVQAFPDANHTWDDFWKPEKEKRKAAGDEHPDPNDFFKVIYGVEGYLVDDLVKSVENLGEDRSFHSDFVVFDIETTGFSPVNDCIIEIGAVKIHAGQIVDRYSTFVNPHRPIPYRIEQLTSIKDSMVVDSPSIEQVLPEFLKFCEGCTLVAHNAQFDMSFIHENMKRQGDSRKLCFVDTLAVARFLYPNHAKHNLDALVKLLSISLPHHHRAVDDAEATAQIFLKFVENLEQRDITSLSGLLEAMEKDVESVRSLKPYHVIILARNYTGRVNLYRLISASHLTYFKRFPKIPKSLLNQYREGLLVGSACEAGELFQAVLEGQSPERIAQIVEFYDYLEVQPLGNNRFMIRSDKYEDINSDEDLIRLNKEIIRLGDDFHKPVVATCDVHFMDPEDEIYRRIIMAGNGYDDADEQAPLYLRTTEEMLAEFNYLGSEKAEEIVITNTNMIADMCEHISPVRPDKCPPVIPHSDETLTEICYNKAHEMYGDPLPEIVEARLQRELNSIISNGYSVMYIIAQKLVWKSVEDGYLVGSRGSVGSSFVATMAGITEVNPLSPHYYCPKCHYNDFYSEEVKKFAGMAGCDMPDRECPNCHIPLKKDGFDIPFETFLGFKGDKEPDIDLNFSGEYQSKAHRYTEVIFGSGQTFKAGTIGGVADKTAYGYVKKYFEERGITKRYAETVRIAEGCTGIRRTTGQHPGGIVVLPVGEEINTFTPVQHPANDMTTDIVTTHFDYHSIDHNLLKLDILGHDDPTMIRMLQDLTGMDPTTIPLDDPTVMSLFASTEALNATPEQIGVELGTLGIPEFGTDFAMQMLIDTKPKYFSDLVRIAGLSHGTDVWLGNAETLIKEGTATISTAICTRDDIMVYLIQMGLEPSHAFSIMENVRKGKVAKGKCKEWEGWKQEMKEHDVPDWYIWSCEKIQYMFPKAHAAAYVMMAWRIAYCKVNFPKEYYCAFFSIRADGFDYELMCQGAEHLEREMKRIKNAIDNKTNKPKDEEVYKAMRLVKEMYARGIDFMPIDIYKAQAKNFQIIDGKIMPSLNSIDGLGDSVAVQITEAVKAGRFLSRDDFKNRAKVPQGVVDKMFELGLLGDLPESNQLSLFDMF